MNQCVELVSAGQQKQKTTKKQHVRCFEKRSQGDCGGCGLIERMSCVVNCAMVESVGGG